MTVTSNGNDSIDGHWEMMGLPVRFDMGHYPDGFPQWLVDDLEAFSGRRMLVNRAYSGTEVIRDHGEQAVEEGAVILYTPPGTRCSSWPPTRVWCRSTSSTACASTPAHS